MATTEKKTAARKTAKAEKTTTRVRKSTPTKAPKAAARRVAKKSTRKTAAPRKQATKATMTGRARRDISYNPQVIEPKWQAKWEADQLYHAVVDESRPKFYALTMLPYPSGDLHIGHWFSMIPPDARARFKRMNGYNVLFPMGFDAFGLNAENAAIRDGIHPMVRTYQNIERMRQQMRTMGPMFDWRREMVSAEDAALRRNWKTAPS